jgi:hypothetical protein
MLMKEHVRNGTGMCTRCGAYTIKDRPGWYYSTFHIGTRMVSASNDCDEACEQIVKIIALWKTKQWLDT